jgi:hypothetical protein
VRRRLHNPAIIVWCGVLFSSEALRAETAEAPAEASANRREAGGDSSVPSAQLARGVAHYDAGQFGRCASTFDALLAEGARSALPPRQVERARVYFAACLIATGEFDAADDQFRQAIRENPQMAIPSTVVFPQEVVDRFIVVRGALLDEIRQAQLEDARRVEEEAARDRERAEAERRRIVELERIVAEEHVVTQNRRWIAWVPMGVGQFQNRDYVLGGVLLTTEAIFAATAIGAMLIELRLHSQADGGRFDTPSRQEVDALNRNVAAARTVSLVATGAFFATAALGILEANLSFVPEFDEGRRDRPRSAGGRSPKSQEITPLAMPIEGGAALVVVGTF